MKTNFISVLVPFFLLINSFAGDLIKVESVLGVEELCISDGSSVYIFSPDKKFRLEPFGLSGRVIEGTWKPVPNGIHVVGQWMWINGVSSNDDFREMDIHVGYLKDEVRDHTSMISGAKHKIYSCYFLIERLEKIQKSD